MVFMVKQLLENYIPYNEQEAFDKLAMLSFIEKNTDFLQRTNLIAHFTCSSIVVNQTMDKVLFAHHNIYKSWGWLGGHNDGDANLLHVAIKETEEETGVKHLIPYDGAIFMLDTIYVPNHMKNGKHISDHLHLNVTYLLIADENEKLTINEQENSGVQWFDIETVLSIVTEPRMISIYTKAFEKVKKLKNRL
jgi:ADP-ribose pyrophosphatase YjhB (NUDIX family)